MRTNITTSLPRGWSIIHESDGQRRLTAIYFAHPNIEQFLILGPESIKIDWTDRQGLSHSEDLARESFYIWIVPTDFKPDIPGFGSFRYFFGPEVPKRIYSSSSFSVYGMFAEHINDTNRMNAVWKDASVISSPDVHPSWPNWSGDIADCLRQQ